MSSSLTNILQLPPFTSMAMTIANNADWIDALAFQTVAGAAIDLRGIDFYAHLRPVVGSATVLLDMSTKNGLLLSGGLNGLLSWKIPAKTMSTIQASSQGSPYVMDILAVDAINEAYVNLFPLGPALVTVVQAVTKYEDVQT